MKNIPYPFGFPKSNQGKLSAYCSLAMLICVIYIIVRLSTLQKKEGEDINVGQYIFNVLMLFLLFIAQMFTIDCIVAGGCTRWGWFLVALQVLGTVSFVYSAVTL